MSIMKRVVIMDVPKPKEELEDQSVKLTVDEMRRKWKEEREAKKALTERMRQLAEEERRNRKPTYHDLLRKIQMLEMRELERHKAEKQLETYEQRAGLNKRPAKGPREPMAVPLELTVPDEGMIQEADALDNFVNLLREETDETEG